MKNFLTSAMALALFVLGLLAPSTTLFAQGDPGTTDDGFVVKLRSSGGYSRDLFNGNDGVNCGWIGTTEGISLTENLCGELVWGYDSTPDSIGCDAFTNDYTDKLVMIRRGTCNFSLKIYNAQLAGAKGVVIVNHYANNAALGDGPCAAHVPSGALFGGMLITNHVDLITIPAVFIQQLTGEEIDAEFKKGNKVNVCFELPNVQNPFAEYHYATPKSQVDSLYNIRFDFLTRGATKTNVVAKADISGPNGYSTTLTKTYSEISADTAIVFDPYKPPAVPGKYTIKYSTNTYTESRDTLQRSFAITDYTWAHDNLTLQLDGGADRNDLFATGNALFTYQVGGLVLTGPAETEVTHVTFGIGNIDSVYYPGGVNEILVQVFDGDGDGDGQIDLSTSWDDISGNLVGVGTYKMKGTEQENVLVDVEIQDIATAAPPKLQAGHPYYVSLLYDGNPDGSVRNCAFSNSAHVPYLNFPSTVMYLGQFYNGAWGDRTVVHRLQTKGYVPGTSAAPVVILDKDKVQITPTLATDEVRVSFNLAEVSDKVMVTLLDGRGSIAARTEVMNNVKEGQFTFNVANLPSGAYNVWTRTKEGFRMDKIMICH